MNLFTPMRQTTNTGIFSASFRSPSAFAKTKDARGILQIATKAYSNAAEAMGKGNELAELNASLQILAILFPNIQYEVLREMLGNFSGDSRLEVVIEQLLKHQDRYVNGRWRNPTHERSQQAVSTINQRTLIALEDSFRSDNYKAAAKRALSLEFKGLSRSTIDAVLAERNFSYTLSRPTLQNIASKTWRRHISTFFMRWRNPARDDPECHFMLSWVRKEGQTGPSEPMLKPTGDAELDHELYTTVLAPFLLEHKKKQSAEDWLLAVNMNAKEAEDAGAVYECECCFSDTNFEHMSACTESGHIVCFCCIRNAINEALFGQSWSRNIDHERGQIRCLAPTVGEGCSGCIPESTVQRAVCQGRAGEEIWSKFGSRVTEQNLLKAQIPLVRCPFCPYAEHNELYLPPSSVQYRLNISEPLTTLVLVVLLLDFIPLLISYSLLCRWAPFLKLRQPSSFLSTSLTRITRSKHLSSRFYCRSPTCGMASCLSCFKAWQDPHICHESATLSLRKTIEAARTAALKRTCPRCGLSFVKESGCNKMTCVCGYVMCYICRQGLGQGEGNQGYEHFCQHFRPAGGSCVACEKCDLYGGEAEASAIARAGQLAEKEWREKEGMVGVEGVGGAQLEGQLARWKQGDWTLQDVVDWYVTKLITC